MKTFFLSFLLLLGGVWGWGQCPTGDIVLTTQGQVDSFAILYPGCTEVLGSVKIDESFNTSNPITNLNGLVGLTLIGGYLNIYYNDSLSNLEGLQSITSIGGDLAIQGCNNLENLAGLQSIEAIGGNFEIFFCDNLENFEGLQSITSIEGNFDIRGCDGIANLDGLQSIASIDTIYIAGCNNLVNLNGFQSLTSISSIYISTCNNLESISGLQSITSIGGTLGIFECNNLESLNGLQSIASIGGTIQIQLCNSLVNLDDLQGITFIGGTLFINSCFNLVNINGLQSITSIGGNLTITKCSNLSNLTGLQSITSIGGDLFLSGCNSLVNLDGLQSMTSIGNNLLIHDCHSLVNLDGLGLQSITSISSISIYNCENLVNLDGLQPITSIGGYLYISHCNSLTTFNGLQALTSIGGNVIIKNCNALLNFDCLSTLNTIGGDCDIQSNPQLSSCAIIALCNKLGTSPNSVIIANNNSGCNSQQEVLQSCASLNNASGIVFIDLNCNSTFDATDQVAPQALLRRVTDNIPVSSTNDTGFYRVYSLPLTTTTYTINAPPGFTPQPTSYTFITDTTLQQFPNQDFRLCPDSLFHNLKTTLTSVTVPRPGFTNQYQICVQNLGTQPENATLTLDFSIGDDPLYITIVDAAGGSVQNNVITWNISNLQLFDSECFTVTVQIAANTPLGIYLQPKSNVSLSPLQTEIKYTDNYVELRDQVVSSYDPNDKTVDMPNISYDPTSGVTRLQYKIRFQNTGTFLTTFIAVLDTLESKLDIRTIEMVAASHNYTLSFPSPNVLKWRFDNINLPDSTSNEAGSHGFVVFNISTKTPINLGEVVQNRAGIYFDFNEPVITNYATTSFTVGVYDPFGLGGLPLSIAPNPTQDNITLRYSLAESADSELIITNAQGVVVVSQRLGKQGVGDYALPVDLVGLPSGLYLVTVRVGGLVGVGKVVRL